MFFGSVLRTFSNRLLLSNQYKGYTIPNSVADPLPLPLGPALHTVSNIIVTGMWHARNKTEQSKTRENKSLKLHGPIFQNLDLYFI